MRNKLHYSNMIRKLFTPDEIIDKFEDFDPKKYKDKGITTILLDIDNTLESNYTLDPSETCIRRINWLKSEGFLIIIYSNNTTKRVERFCKDLDVEWYAWSAKPLNFVYHKILKKHKLKRSEVLTIGDQLLTDVLGTKKAGLTSIYVRPFTDKEEFYTRFNRNIERFIFKHVIKM